jgi:nitroreductase
MISELILKCRSFRRFYQEIAIPESDLLEMVNNARLSASGRNMQSMKYIIVHTKQMCNELFPLLSWAGYIPNQGGTPKDGERPSAYLVMLNDNNLSSNYFWDHGIAAQNILLTAVEKGWGGVIIGAVNREKLRELWKIPAHLDVLQVIALGKPKETVVIEPMTSDGSVKYWRDENGIHHVPKRTLEDIIVHLPNADK